MTLFYSLSLSKYISASNASLPTSTSGVQEVSFCVQCMLLIIFKKKFCYTYLVPLVNIDCVPFSFRTLLFCFHPIKDYFLVASKGSQISPKLVA